MSDQTFEPRLDSLLRDVLKAEVASLPLTVKPEQVLERGRARNRGRLAGRLGFPRLSMAVATGAVAVVIVVAGAVGLNFFVNEKPGIGAASPSPSAAPATPEPTPASPEPISSPTSGGMWPQSTLDEVQQAQERADAGDPDYTWQVDPLLDQQGGRWWLHLLDGRPDITDRFIREVLGWDRYMVNVYVGRADDNEGSDGVLSDISYLRCASGGGNAEQGEICAPTLDELHHESVRIDLAQLDRHGPDGVWVVSNWTMTPPFAPVTQVTTLVESFLQARVDGTGAEELVLTAEDTEVPLLYATSTGAPYERYEFERLRGPGWAADEFAFEAKLFADGGQTVVEQDLRWWGSSPAELYLPVATTTENGQFVTVRYEFLDGKVSAFAQYPWQPDCGDSCLGLSSATGYIEIGVAPPSVDECLVGPTDPVSVSIGAFAALVIDGRGAAECGVAQAWLGTGKPVRFYLIDLPDGSSVRTLAVTVIADGVSLNSVIEAATPIIESIEFHDQ